MAITSRPKVTDEKELEKFIGGAPDAKPETSETQGVVRGKRVQITHTLVPVLLAKLDARADEMGMTRASLINLALAEYLEK